MYKSNVHDMIDTFERGCGWRIVAQSGTGEIATARNSLTKPLRLIDCVFDVDILDAKDSCP